MNLTTVVLYWGHFRAPRDVGQCLGSSWGLLWGPLCRVRPMCGMVPMARVIRRGCPGIAFGKPCL